MNILMIRKKFNEASVPEKEDFYSHLNFEYTTDADYLHIKRFSKENLEEYHDLYVQSKTLLSTDLRTLNICLEIHELDPEKFLSAPGLAWKATLKKRSK